MAGAAALMLPPYRPWLAATEPIGLSEGGPRQFRSFRHYEFSFYGGAWLAGHIQAALEKSGCIGLIVTGAESSGPA